MQQGKVLQLFMTKNDTDKTKLSPTTLHLTSEGVVDDKFYAKDPQRAILITTIQSYEMAQEQGIAMEYGMLGENILIDINPYHLQAGEQLQIGECTLEITQNCTLCKGLSTINSKLPKLLKDDRGIFAKVIQGNSLHVNDRVSLA
jgi:MOSC domain-containing protein YiiM